MFNVCTTLWHACIDTALSGRSSLVIVRHALKGTVSWDFRPLFFFFFLKQLLNDDFEFCRIGTVFGEIFDYEIVSAVYDTPGSEL